MKTRNQAIKETKDCINCGEKAHTIGNALVVLGLFFLVGTVGNMDYTDTFQLESNWTSWTINFILGFAAVILGSKLSKYSNARTEFFRRRLHKILNLGE